MLRLAVPFILLLLLLFAGTAWLIDMKPRSPEPAEKQAQKSSKPQSAKSEAQDVQEALSPPPPSADGAPSFDVARVNPNGTSVFAGRAEPGSSVTITADGKSLGTVQADANGEWTFTTDEKIPNANAKLALFKAPPGAGPHVADSRQQDAKPDPGAPQPPKQQSAGAVTSKMLKNLEGMVAEARTKQGERELAAAPPTPLANDSAPPASVTTARPSPLSSSSERAVESASVPVPVTFIFNEATLTGDGKKAAGLLLEYLRLKHFGRVRLTGHADERGTDELNMKLSRERLETVAHFLREGGFRGQLELIPKGKSEPYSGVVRGDFNREDLYQLDRRVELVVSR
jgi:outer membrane protein OmpA-like peptidoglycan-associated protein